MCMNVKCIKQSIQNFIKKSLEYIFKTMGSQEYRKQAGAALDQAQYKIDF